MLIGRRRISGKQHPTIYDVAALAGVSIGTVSKALNSPTQVADATRKRVLDAVHKLDYVAKEAATSRARRGSGRIGVFAPFTSYPSYGERLNGILGVMAKSNTEVVVFDVESAERSADVLESLPALRSLDGLIIMSVPFADRVASALRRGRMPVVLVDTKQYDFPAVLTDDAGGGALAASTLVDSGKSRLAYIGQKQVLDDFDSASRRRQGGFERELAARGIPLRAEDIVLVGNDFEDSRAAAAALLSGSTRPDGVFAHSDELAAAVWSAAIHLGLAVPDDVAIIGFDDGPLARVLGLSTIRQPLRETGEWSARSILSMIANPNTAVPSVTLSVALERRQSTG